jgi:A-factor biosynthesis hotdog domain
LFNERGRSPEADILYYTELGRQASIAISHSFLDVDEDQAFIFQESEASLMENFWRSQDRFSPAFSIVIEVRAKEIKRRKNGAITGVLAEYAMYNQYCQVFRGSGEWLLQSEAMFERFRRAAAQSSSPLDREQFRVAMSPSRLGREHATNVVISIPERNAVENGELVSTLIVDQDHP